nr:MAG TPA: hypothetical protein [Caudoviricetes sp.]
MGIKGHSFANNYYMLCDENGYIQLPEIAAKGAIKTLDDEGFPVKTLVSWSCPIPCQWRAKLWDNTSQSQGESVVSSVYSILVDWLPELPIPERVRLLPSYYEGQADCSEGVELQVIEARPLKAVRKYLIKAK